MSVRTIQGGSTVDIEPGDWVDGDQSALSPDPQWGFSYEVASVPPGETYVMVNMWNGSEYEQAALDCSLILKNHREISQNSV